MPTSLKQRAKANRNTMSRPVTLNGDSILGPKRLFHSPKSALKYKSNVGTVKDKGRVGKPRRPIKKVGRRLAEGLSLRGPRSNAESSTALSSRLRPAPQTYFYPTSASLSSLTLSEESIGVRKRTTGKSISLSTDSRRRIELESTRTFEQCTDCQRKISAKSGTAPISTVLFSIHKACITSSNLQGYTENAMNTITQWMLGEDPYKAETLNTLLLMDWDCFLEEGNQKC